MPNWAYVKGFHEKTKDRRLFKDPRNHESRRHRSVRPAFGPDRANPSGQYFPKVNEVNYIRFP